MERPLGSSHCHQHTLAKGGTAHVQTCRECGTLTMHVGAISLRFDPAALESLWNTLGEALLTLHAQQAQVDECGDARALARLRPRGSA